MKATAKAPTKAESPEGGRYKVNRAFYIIAVPALFTTFGWVTFGWNWRLAAVITAGEAVLMVAAVVFLARRNAQKARKKAS